MIISLLVLLGIFLVSMYLIGKDREEIQKRQAQIQMDLDVLKEAIKEEEKRRHKEQLQRPYDAEV